MIRALALFALVWKVWTASPALAAEARWALVIGNNTGLSSDGPLRFAERDAERVEAALLSVGGFARERVFRVIGGDVHGARAVLQAVEVAIQASEPGALLFVYYSGHADAHALRMAGTTWPLNELERAIKASKATARVVVLDACRSGTVTRVKGGAPGPSYAIALDDQMVAHGTAILASTAAGEDALESDELQASYFTHHFLSALFGAADGDNDGRVTVSEAFQYASQHTLASTASTMAGPQHPTYRLELGGRHELVLARPGAIGKRLAVVELPVAGTWIFRRADRERMVVGEVVADQPGRRMTVEPGSYRVTLRTPTSIQETTLLVAAGETRVIDLSLMQRHRAPREATKGERTITSPSLAQRFLREEPPEPIRVARRGDEPRPSEATPRPDSDTGSEIWGVLAAGAAFGQGGGAAVDLGLYFGHEPRFPHYGAALTLDLERAELVGLSVGAGLRDGIGLGELRGGVGFLGKRVGARFEVLAALEPRVADTVRLRFAASGGLGFFDLDDTPYAFGRVLVGVVFGR